MKKWSLFLRKVPEFRPSLLLRAPVVRHNLSVGPRVLRRWPSHSCWARWTALSVRGGQGDGPWHVAPRRTCPAHELPCHSSHHRLATSFLPAAFSQKKNFFSSCSSAGRIAWWWDSHHTPASRWVGPTAGTNNAYPQCCDTVLALLVLGSDQLTITA